MATTNVKSSKLVFNDQEYKDFMSRITSTHKESNNANVKKTKIAVNSIKEIKIDGEVIKING